MSTMLRLRSAISRNPACAKLPFMPGRVVLSGLSAEIVHIRNLQFPFPVRLDVEAGLCDVSIRGFTRTLRVGDARILPGLEQASIALLRQARLALTIVPEPAALTLGLAADRNGEPVSLVIDDVLRRKPLTACISLAVFMAPHSDWRLSSAGAVAGIPSGPLLSRKLLQESQSLRDMVRIQRLSRFVFDTLLSVPDRLASSYGFSDRCRLENAVYDHFGISVESLARISSNAGRRGASSIAGRVAA